MIRRIVPLLLLLILVFSCDMDEDNTTSLEWILLVSNNISFDDNLHNYGYEVKTCEEMVYYDSYHGEGKYYFSDGESRRCICQGDGNECGDCFIGGTGQSATVESCDGYTLCEESNYTNSECCYSYEIDVVNENGIQETDASGNPLTETIYEYRSELFYKYRLLWNNNISVCNNGDCDIIIPSNIPSASFTDVCESNGMAYCEDDYYFHTYCDNIIDTTLIIKNKSISFIKIGWFERNNNSYNSLEYDSQNKLITTDGSEWNFFNDGWNVVEYQTK